MAKGFEYYLNQAKEGAAPAPSAGTGTAGRKNKEVSFQNYLKTVNERPYAQTLGRGLGVYEHTYPYARAMGKTTGPYESVLNDPMRITQAEYDEQKKTLSEQLQQIQLQGHQTQMAMEGYMSYEDQQRLKAQQEAQRQQATALQQQLDALDRQFSASMYESAYEKMQPETRTGVDQLGALVAERDELIRRQSMGATPYVGDWKNSDQHRIQELGRQISAIQQGLSGTFTEEEIQSLTDQSLKNYNAAETKELQESVYARALGRTGAGNLGARIGNTLLSGVGAVDIAMQNLTAGTDAITGLREQVDYNTKWQQFQHRSTAVTEAHNENIVANANRKYGEGTKAAETAIKASTFANDILVSMGQSAAAVGLTALGVPGATLLLGASAATSTMHQYHEMGYSDGQALAMGLVAGAAETITEKIGIDNLFALKSLKGLSGKALMKALGGNLLSQGKSEAMEEGLSNIFNTIADAIILGDENTFRKDVEALVAQGMDRDEAEKQVLLNWVKGLASDMLAGGISGLLFGGAQAPMSVLSRNLDAEIAAGAETDIQEAVEAAVEAVVQENEKETRTPGTKKHAEEILASPERRAQFEAESKIKLTGTKAEQRRQIREYYKNKTVEAQTAAQEAQTKVEDTNITEEQKTAQRAAQAETDIKNAAMNVAEMGGINENISDAGQGNGFDGVGAGGQAGVFSEAAGRAEADGQGDQRQVRPGVGESESAVVREVTPAELGVTGGDTQSRVQLIDTERAGKPVQKAAEAVRSIGMEPVAYQGQMTVNGAPVRGWIENGKIYFQTDAVDGSGNPIDPKKIVDHEMFHEAAANDPGLVEDVKSVVRDKMSEDAFDKMREKYKTAYGKVQDFSGWTEEQIETYLMEEIAADAYAGLNYFADDTELRQEVQTAAPQVGQAQTAQGTAEARGPPTGRAMVAGINAKTADSNSLRRAEEMERDGMDNESIRQETGWYRGMDGQWRFEIDDSGMEFRKDGDARLMQEEDYRRLSELTARWEQAFNNGEELSEAEQQEMDRLQEQYKDRVWEEKYRLRDFVKHDELFRAYPYLNRISLVFDDLPDGAKGYYSRRDNTIVLSDALFGKEPESVLHEIQHVIQKIEGFAGGANPGYWTRRMESGYSKRWSNGLEMMPSELYYNTAGEIEARDTANRRGLTAEERKKIPPYLGDENTVFVDRMNEEANYSRDKEGYATDSTNWAYDNYIIDEADRARFYEVIADLNKRGYSVPRTKNGAYIIEHENKLMYTDGDYKAPTLSKVIVFEVRYDANMADAKGMIFDEERRTAGHGASAQVLRDLYGEGYITEYNARTYQRNAGENRRGKGIDRGTADKTDSGRVNRGKASVEVEPTEQLTPQEKALVNDHKLELKAANGRKVTVQIRERDTGGWDFRVDTKGEKTVFSSRKYRSAQEAAREAVRIGEQYALPEPTRAQNAMNEAADAAAEAGVERESPPPRGRYTKKDMELEEDRKRTLVEADAPWGTGDEMRQNDAEAQAAADSFADERAEKAAQEDLEQAFADYADMLHDQLPVRDKEAAEEKVTSEVKAKKPATARDKWRSLVRTIVNAGDTIHRIARETGNKSLDGYYFRALAARQAGTEWITGKRHDIMGRATGKGLNEIFDPIRAKGRDYYEQFQLYLFHMHNIDRMSRSNEQAIREAREEVARLERIEPGLSKLADADLERIAESGSIDAPLARDYLEAKRNREKALQKKNKPVFDFDVTAEDSRAAVQRLLEKHPEFEELAKDVYEYCNDLLQYRVDAGLMKQSDKEALQRIYPHYVPTFRAVTKDDARVLHKGGISVSKAIGRATGGNETLLPLHVALARQTMTVTRNGAINRLGNALLQTRDENKDAMSQYILNVKEAENGFSEDTFDQDEVQEPRKENVITVIEDGKRYDLTLDEGLADAFKAFEPDKYADMAIMRASKSMVDVFKKLVTAWNPMFTVRNVLRDVQDAQLYSKDLTAWWKNIGAAYKEIAQGGKYWQMYKGLGGNYASIFDYTTGEARADKGGISGAIEKANRVVEAAPRLAEFMAIVKKAEARGELTEADLMEAFEAAQDITTNFGRAGSLGGMLNKYFVPFLNPSIQGADKFIRNLSEREGARAWAQLVVRAAALGIAPAIINGMLHRADDDWEEEWDDISEVTKANNYLFKVRDGVWIKIPRGRALAVLSTAGVAAEEAIKGNDIDPADFLEVITTNLAPQNPLEASIFRALLDSKLWIKDDPGRTWYGGEIESEYMQSFRPGERYDESTDVISKWLGKTFNLSPAKINYLLDQYSGVFGDLLLPLLTPQAERDPFSKAFTVDTVTSNETTGEYYDLFDELKWDMNGGDIAAGTTYRYMSHVNEAVSDYYADIREIENDPDLSNKEKKELTRELRRGLIEYQKEILETAEKYRLAAEEYYDEHPELDHEDEDAVRAYMEQYNAQQYDEKYYKDEDATASLMEAIVYREVNREVLGAEYALETYSESVYEKAQEANRSAGVSYDTYYEFYFGTKDMYADRDENGESISGTKKAKVLGFIAGMDIPDEQKDALAVAAGYKTGSWKSYEDGETENTSGKKSGGRGGRSRSKKAKALKIDNSLTKPAGVSSSRAATIAARSGNVSAYEDIQKVTRQIRKKNPWWALPTGNPEIDEERPAAARYFETGRF